MKKKSENHNTFASHSSRLEHWHGRWCGKGVGQGIRLGRWQELDVKACVPHEEVWTLSPGQARKIMMGFGKNSNPDKSGFAARAVELVYKTMWTLLWGSKEDMADCAENWGKYLRSLGRLECYDFLLLGKDHKRIFDPELSHSLMTENLHLLLVLIHID